MEKSSPVAPKGEFLIFESDDGQTKVECRLESDNLWLSQAQIAQLYQKNVRTISEHLVNIGHEKEVDLSRSSKKFQTVRKEGKRYVSRMINHYNLEAILAIGFRVRSSVGTQFRSWATKSLQTLLTKGIVAGSENGDIIPTQVAVIPDCFSEMLDCIRDIRASESQMYTRVKELFTLSADYEVGSEENAEFFRNMQNKLHYASTGMTAAELISQRVDGNKPNAGLVSFKGDEVRKADVTVAKNYLQPHEIKALNRIVVMWLNYAEDQALLGKQIFLKDWEEKLDSFLEFNDRRIFQGSATVTRLDANEKAKYEYERFTAKLNGSEGNKNDTYIQALHHRAEATNDSVRWGTQVS